MRICAGQGLDAGKYILYKLHKTNMNITFQGAGRAISTSKSVAFSLSGSGTSDVIFFICLVNVFKADFNGTSLASFLLEYSAVLKDSVSAVALVIPCVFSYAL